MPSLPKLRPLASTLLLVGLWPAFGATSLAASCAPHAPEEEQQRRQDVATQVDLEEKEDLGDEEARPPLPWTLRGDGLTLRMTAFDESTLAAGGTIQVAGKSSFPFTVDFEVNGEGMLDGSGKVQESKRAKRLALLETCDGSVRVSYRAKRYVVTMVEGAAHPTIPSDTPGVLRVALHTFHDPRARMPSHTVLLPKGWKAEGGAHWFPNALFQLMPSQEIRIESPEGLLVAIDPSFSAREYDPIPASGMPKPREGSVDGGTPIIYFPRDIEAWKRLVIKELKHEYPKATNVRVKDAQLIDEPTAQLRREFAPAKRSLQRDHALMTPPGMRASMDADAYVIGFESYYTLGGRDYEEMRLAVISYHTMENEMTGRTTSWSVERGFSFRAPVGTLEENMQFLGTIAGSVRATGQWSQMVAKLVAQRNGTNHAVAMNGLKEAGRRANIIFAAGSAANDISMKGYHDRSASQDRIQGQVVNAINGARVYTVPGSGASVELPDGYSNVFTDSNGEYLLTNDALFQPGSDLTYDGKTWTAMQLAGR